MSDKYKIAGGHGTSYLVTTAPSMIPVLEQCRVNQIRIAVRYQENGPQHRGYVGRTTGQIKCPLLVHNSRSRGGVLLSEDSIIEIRVSRGGRLLWAKTSAKTTQK